MSMEIKWFIWDGIIYPNRPFYFHGDKMAIKPIRDTHFYSLSRGGDSISARPRQPLYPVSLLGIAPRDVDNYSNIYSSRLGVDLNR